MGTLGAMIFLLGSFAAFVVTCVLLFTKNKNWKKALLCIPLCIVVGFVLMMISPSSEENTSTNEITVETEVKEEVETVAETEVEDVQEETTKPEVDTKVEITETKTNVSEDIITVGSTFEVKDLYITINDADFDFTDYEDTYNFYEPNKGMKYIMVSFTFENQNKSDKYVSIYDFDCYADGTACEQAYLPDDSDFINTNISTGRNVSFRTYYEVPITAEKLELEYSVNMFSDKKVIIELN